MPSRTKKPVRCLCGHEGDLMKHLRSMPIKGTLLAFGKAPDGRTWHGLDAGEDDLFLDVGSPPERRKQDPWEPCGP